VLTVSVESFLRPDNNDINQLTEKLIFGVGCILAGQFLGEVLSLVMILFKIKKIIVGRIQTRTSDVCFISGAVQMIVEELLLKQRRYPPLNVVGMEGVFGLLLMIVIVLPLIYFIPG
jgi:hypothetical protein